MDPALWKAAREGDVKFLKEAVVAKQPSSYFLAQEGYCGNILHIAVRNRKVEFLKEAMNILPKDLQKQLLIQTIKEVMYTVLHEVAYCSDITVFKCIMEMYESFSWDDEDPVKPWLALTRDNETPLNFALRKSDADDKCVMQIMLLDPKHESWTIADKDGNTPLYYALKNGCNLVVENILKFLKQAVPVQPSKYFFARCSRMGENVFHVAASQGNVEFMKEAMNILPTANLKQLLLQTTYGDMYTVLHRAALKRDVTLVKFITEMYASLSWVDEDHVKPWLALTQDNKTPLHIASRLHYANEDCVMEILLLDAELTSCTIADEDGNTPLYYALKNGLNLVVKNILKFLKEAVPVQPSKYFFAESTRENVFHVATDKGNVEFMKEAIDILPTANLKQLLLQTTEKDMHTVVHRAALNRDVTLVKFIREMYASLSWVDEDHVKPWLALTQDNKIPLHLALRLDDADDECVWEILLVDADLTTWTIADEDGNTPLYYAVKNGLNLVAENILMSPLPHTSIFGSSSLLELIRLATTNCSGNVKRLLCEKYGRSLDSDGNTLLHSALNSTSTQELALKTLSTYPELCKFRNNRGESPFFLAVKSGYEQVVDEIMRIDEPHFNMLRRNDGNTVLHNLSSCPEITGKSLLEKYWWMINLRDDHGKTALDYAKQANVRWLVNLLTKPSRIHKEDFDFIGACEREENLAVFAFVETCEDLQWTCRLKNDSPLHHIKLPSYRDYLNFLKNPAITELKNMTDHDGTTPLHRALEREDIDLVKALLLDDGVKKTIKDYHGTTPMDLLAKLCKKNDKWDKMCKLIKVNPDLKTSYIQEGANLEQIRNTLSVVAALLATITFAAAFTLPGGLKGDTGDALLAKKASFLIFLLADVYAMCTSMLVLFCLIWSMVSERDMARLLVDRSVFLLMHSLYGTLLAFMTAVYTVIANSSLWAAIIIFVMCSIIGISANRTILHTVIAKLVPAANTEKQDQASLLEEGRLVHLEWKTICIPCVKFKRSVLDKRQ